MLELQITQTRYNLSILDGKMSKFNTLKNEKIFMKCAQIGGAYLQFVNNHYAKLE